MLDAGVAVGDHVHVHVKERAALGDHHHAFTGEPLRDLLTLFAARLVVVLHADRTLGLQTPHVSERVIEGVDARPGGTLRTVDDLAGGEDAGRQDLAGTGIFGGGETLTA